jgi:hypothetical protein
VLIYDGNHSPTAGTVIGGVTLQGTSPSGTSNWFTWTPQTGGWHTLHSELLGGADDVQVDSANGDLRVLVVRAAGDINGDGVVDQNDLAIIEQNKNQTVANSACGFACDLNGDGVINNADEELAVTLCTNASCSLPTGQVLAATAETQLRAANQSELEALRQLKPQDWANLNLNQAKLPVGEAVYLKSLQSMVAGSPANH